MKTRRILGASLLAAATLALQGCGTTVLSSRTGNPVIQDFAYRWFSDDSVLSTTASRRLALMSYRKGDDGRTTLITCAEPPPDVGETFAKALAAQLEASVPKPAGDIKVGAGFGEQVATALAPLMVRTQGLQVLRDSAFTLCVDYMNGWIQTPEAYMQAKNERFDKAVQLIMAELPLLPGRAVTPPATVAAPALPAPATAPLPVAASAAMR